MFELGKSFILEERYLTKLKALKEKMNSAEKLNLKECQKCGFCCWQRPCSLSKEDVKNISLFLKISENELFEQYLVVDEIQRKLLLLPRRIEQEDVAGEYLQFDRTYDIDSPCIFLDDNNLCKIHDVKSKQAKSFKCWEETSGEDDFAEWTEENLISLGWSGLKDPFWDAD